jgi:hypothetical protein
VACQILDELEKAKKADKVHPELKEQQVKIASSGGIMNE